MHLIPDAAACQGRKAKKYTQQTRELQFVLDCKRWCLTFHHKAGLGDTYLLQSGSATTQDLCNCGVLCTFELPKGLSGHRALYGEVDHGQTITWAFSSCSSIPAPHILNNSASALFAQQLKGRSHARARSSILSHFNKYHHLHQKTCVLHSHKAYQLRTSWVSKVFNPPLTSPPVQSPLDVPNFS